VEPVEEVVERRRALERSVELVLVRGETHDATRHFAGRTRQLVP
jgi:hypothetical protein